MELREAHRAMLERGSGIDQAVVAARGYATVEDPVCLERLGFGGSQRRVPGLLVPIHGTDGGVVLRQYRPDDPRKDKRGKAVKYETPVGSSLRIDVPPGALLDLSNPAVPLFVTEGSKKADCAVGHGLCCIALMGVNGYRGKRSDGTKGELEDWDRIALEGREVYLAFDSDVSTKPEVRRALDGLSAMLRGRGARVRVVLLPQTGDGKVGLDDWFAGGGDVAGLMELAVDPSGLDVKKTGRLLLTWAEFSQESDEVAWLVEGLLPSEGTSVLIAQPKVGKTTLVYWLARCVALGEPFLGRDVRQGTVVLLLAEGSKPMHRGGLSRASLPKDAPVHVYADSFGVGLAKIRDEIKSLAPKPSLIVVDTLFKMLRPEDGNDYASMVKAMERMTDLARELCSHVLSTHHSSKSTWEGASVGARSLGSTAIYGAVDTTVSLERRGDVRTVSSEQRWGEPLAETDLTFDEGSGAVTLGGTAAERRGDVVAERIRSALAAEPLTETELKKRVTDNSVGAVLRRLVDAGEVVKEGKGAKGSPYRYAMAAQSLDDGDGDPGFSFLPIEGEKPETTKEAVLVI